MIHPLFEDHDLKFLFAEAFRSAMPGDGCPAAADLLDAATGDAPVEARHGIVDHIGGCPMCAELWRLAAGEAR